MLGFFISTEKNLTSVQLEKECYPLQNKIYENRRSNPLIFDWMYYLYRDNDEDMMKQGIEDWLQKLR